MKFAPAKVRIPIKFAQNYEKNWIQLFQQFIGSISLKFLLETRLQPESFDTLDNLLGFRVGLLDAFCKNTGHFDLSAAPNLSCVAFRKRHRENRETISIVKPQLIICPYFGWLIAFRCVCDVKSH